MKKLFILVGFILMFIEPLFSQNTEKNYSNSYNALVINDNSKLDYKKNSLKIDPCKLLLGGINFSYERILTRRTSINFRAKFHPLGFVERRIEGFSVSGDNFEFRLTDRPNFYHYGFDAEYRFYLMNKKAAQGFYVAPYARYLNYTGKMKSNYTEKGTDLPVSIDSYLKPSFNIWGCGIQLGAQWLIKDKISIDWGFAGLGIDRYIFQIDVNSDNLSNIVDKYTQDLQNVMGRVSGFLMKKIAFNALDNNLSSRVPFWMVGWKSFLTVGIRF